MKTTPFLVIVGMLAALSAAVAINSKESKPGPTAAVSAGSPAAAPAGEPSASTVVAELDGTAITLGELDGQLKDDLAGLDDQFQKQKMQLRKQALEGMIIQRLVKGEAAKKGMTEEQWIKAEIEGQVPAPSEEEIKQTFEAAASQLPPGATYEEYRERIAEHLSRPAKQQVAAKVFEDLRKQHKVSIKLSEPRKPVDAKGPSRGPADAKVTIVEFSDFQCPYCSKAHDTVEKVMEAYAGKVRLVFRQFPLEFHEKAPKAAEASLCAADQAKFWEYHTALFQNQDKLEVNQLKEHAKSLGLDMAKFEPCLDSGQKAAIVKEDLAAGKKVGVSGTPAFFINGRMLSGAQPESEFRKVIDEELGG